MLDKLLVQPIMNHAERFSREVFNSLAPFSLNLLKGLCLLWIMWTVYNALIEGKFDWQNILKKILIFCVIASMLTVNNKLFYEYIYDPIKYATNELVNNILSIDPKSNLRRLGNSNKSIQEIDDCFSKLVSLIMLISKKASFIATAATSIVTCVIWGLFVIAEAMFAVYLVGNTLKLAAISALSPLLILTFAFEYTRSYAVSGLKYVLASALTLLVASFCMALVLLALQNIISSLLVENVQSDRQVFSALSTLFILALSSIYFLKLAPEIASTIIGVGTSSIMSNVIGGFMGSAIAGTVPMGKQYVSNVAHNIKSKFAANYAPTKEEKK